MEGNLSVPYVSLAKSKAVLRSALQDAFAPAQRNGVGETLDCGGMTPLFLHAPRHSPSTALPNWTSANLTVTVTDQSGTVTFPAPGANATRFYRAVLH